MITITPQAAAQIRRSAEHNKTQDMPLRIAVRREEDGTFVYGMGFDNHGDDDTAFVSEGINVLVANSVKDMLQGATLDYVEMEPGQHQFIFINPNDPAHKQPGDDGKS